MVQEAVQTGHLTVYQDDPARDWTFALDVGAAVAALLDQPKLIYALYNVASEQMLSPLEIAMTLKTLLPDLSLDIREGTNPNVPPLTRRGYLSNQRLEKETGFTGWTAFKDGLQKVLAEQHKSEVTK
jgi:nucleoside-diphosphate-sugar epimerase